MDNTLFNKWGIYFFYFSIAIYPLSMMMNIVFQQINIDFLTGRSIYIGYGLVYLFAIIVLVKFGFSLKRLVALYCIYILYFILYLTSPQSVKSVYTSTVMMMIYVYYLPYSVLILTRIGDFSQLFSSKLIEYTNYVIIVSSFIAKYFFQNQTNYMTFSYQLLPIWMLFTFSFIRRPTLLKAGVALVMLLEGVIYGARGPLIWLVIGAVVYFIFLAFENKFISNLSLKKISQIVLWLGLFIGIFSVARKSLPALNIENSYILNRLEQGNIGVSTGRNEMIDIAINYLKQMGGEINGLFFDRTLMPDNIYVHNFILETYLSFGWFIGTLILISLVYFIGKTFLYANKRNKMVLIFAVPAFFLKYFLTGSMYEGDSFIIMMALVCAIYSHAKQERKMSDID
ncbi:hypothetical protein PW252_06265 [Streptococcus sp. 29887]|uniref:Uncharacterized protein n=2 Tax=Streptococcus iners TaxID=3028084 RepID=A0AA96VJM4_9STRE|nr:hypothetical protein [Streptococcus sp. 29887]MCK4025461.1 hypothetical protein [Streptococcus suis]WNY50187.1 hypothetical protein PW252_06265 [Streptococcus sp. 29887]